jgi:hypothetical protein
MKTISLIRLALIGIFLLLSQNYLLAQPPPDPITGCWPPPCVPIDGGVSFLLIAGAAYGGKKIYDNARKSKREEQH